MRCLLLAAGSAVLILALSGCGTANAQAKKGIEKDRTGALSPIEKYEHERLEKALTGVMIVIGTVQVDVSKSVLIAKPGTRSQSLTVTAEGAALLAANNQIGAAGKFAKAIIIDRTNAAAYRGLGKALEPLGEVADAMAAFKTSLSFDSKSVETRYELAQGYQALGALDRQIEQLKGIAKSNPGYLETESRLAIASYYQNEFGLAWTYVHKSEALGKPVPPQFKELLESKAGDPGNPPQR